MQHRTVDIGLQVSADATPPADAIVDTTITNNLFNDQRRK